MPKYFSVYRPPRDGMSLVWFIVLSLLFNSAGAYSGYFWHTPEPQPILLTDIDINDAPPLGDPNVPEDAPQTPPEPEPTPPPEPEPTPPPLDKPPEFEIPSPTPSPTPAERSMARPTAHPQVKQANPNANPNAAGTPGTGVGHGSANGVKGGTGNGGPRSGKLVRSPLPPYPPQALQNHITGNCVLAISVSGGNITGVSAVSGPSILSASAARWVRSNWQFAAGTSGVFTLPVAFVIR